MKNLCKIAGKIEDIAYNIRTELNDLWDEMDEKNDFLMALYQKSLVECEIQLLKKCLNDLSKQLENVRIDMNDFSDNGGDENGNF